MDDFKQECRLCDNIIRDENFKAIDDVAKNIFHVLLLKLTLNETQNVMCVKCSSNLIAAFNFKSKCLENTGNAIIPYVDFKNPKPTDKQIYAKAKENKQVGRLLDERDICRLCLQPMTGDHKSIQEVPIDSIEIYVPEINFEAFTNSVICIKCYDALHVHSNFIKNCVGVDKGNEDAKNCGEIFLNYQSIKTEEIEIKSEETDEEVLFGTICDIKKEKHDEWDTPLKSQIDLMHTEESLYDLDIREQSTVANYQSEECSFKSTPGSRFAGYEQEHKKASEARVNKSDLSSRNSKRRCLTRGLKGQEYECDKCTYNTKYKGNFVQHQLIHKDPSEVQMYECDECLYRSIRKDSLKRHQLIHKDPSKVRIFKCDKCDYKSKQKGHLKQHQLRHKYPSEVRVFKCDECDYKSIRKGNLLMHQLRHKDPSEVRVFKCNECDYKSIRKCDLNHHELIHKDPSEVEMYKCEKCSYITRHKRSLISHCLSHRDPTEVRVFHCDKCDYKTIRKDHLKLHQLRRAKKGNHQLTHTNSSKGKM